MNRRRFLKLATIAGCGYLSGCITKTTRLSERADWPQYLGANRKNIANYKGQGYEMAGFCWSQGQKETRL
jgi:hypothetical protein